MRRILPIACATAVLAACTIGMQGTSPPTPDIDASVTAAIMQTMRPMLVITLTPPPEFTAIPYAPITVTTWADNVLLRSNPGYLFTRLGTLQKGTPLTVLSQSPGGEWLHVRDLGDREGWIFTALVETAAYDMSRVPFEQPQGVLELRGLVTDTSGNPVSDIQYSITQGEGARAPRNDARTDESGVFHAFMPPDTSGTWWVAYTAIGCDSNIVDEQCMWVGTSVPGGMYVVLPDAGSSVLEFAWR